MVLNPNISRPSDIGVTTPRDKTTDGKLPQLRSPCCSSSGITMRNQSVQEGAHAEDHAVDHAELCKFGGGDRCNNITPPI